MLQYNTHNTRLPMPEYGRYVQQLVDKCVTIEDRDERNAFAAGIVATICNLFPQQKTSPVVARQALGPSGHNVGF